MMNLNPIRTLIAGSEPGTIAGVSTPIAILLLAGLVALTLFNIITIIKKRRK